MARALVTGSTGFLGQQLVRQLLDRGIAIRCLVRASSNTAILEAAAQAIPDSRLEIVRGDLLKACPDILQDCDVVFHLAAEMQGAPAVLFMGNVVATRRLLELAVKASLRRFVLVSSIAVHDTNGLQAGAVVDETCPLDPKPHERDSYTFSKVVQEQLAWEAFRQERLPLVVVRPGVIFGPGRDCLAGRMGLRLGNFMLVMNGRRQLPYTYRDNCARAILQAGLEGHVPVGESFNIVDDHAPSPRELLAEYRRTVSSIGSLTLPGWAVAGLSSMYAGYSRWSEGQLPPVLTPYKSNSLWKRLDYANTKAKTVLGWKPEVDFATGLKRTLESLKESRASAGLASV